MAAETVAIACAADVYTALSSGATDVSFKGSGGGGKFVIAAALPEPGETDFFPVDSREMIALGSLDGNVYYMPNAGAATVYVVRV